MPKTATSSTVVAFFNTESAAEEAVRSLLDAGFTASQIGVASRASDAAGTSVPDSDGRLNPVATHSDTTAHNAGLAGGAAANSAWDKVKSFFISDSVEPYADEKGKGDLASHEINSGCDDYSHEDIHHSLSGMSVPVSARNTLVRASAKATREPSLPFRLQAAMPKPSRSSKPTAAIWATTLPAMTTLKPIRRESPGSSAFSSLAKSFASTRIA